MASADGRTSLDPIVHTRLVHASPSESFTAFVEELGRWWDPRLTPDEATFRDIEAEPQVGGALRMVHDGRQPFEFARVTAWLPGEQVTMELWLALDRAHPTTLTVDFEPEEPGTRVTLTHGGWTPENASRHATFGEWGQLLDRFARHVEG